MITISGIMLIQELHLQSQHGPSQLDLLYLLSLNLNTHLLNLLHHHRVTAAAVEDTIRGVEGEVVTKSEEEAMTTIITITMVPVDTAEETVTLSNSNLSMEGIITIRGTTFITMDRTAMDRRRRIQVEKEQWVRIHFRFFSLFLHKTNFGFPSFYSKVDC